MIYEFVDESKHLHLTNRPAEAMLFNGQYLEDIVPEYKTVSVMGRETLSMHLATSGEMPARDGEILEGANVKAREITVTYALVASTNESFRTAYDKMKHHFLKSREPVPIKFDDEPAYTYYGIISNVPEVEPGVNTVVGEIVIHCFDPYKYADAISASAVGSVAFPTGLTQPIRPIIQVDLVASATKVVITNAATGKKIILNGSYVAGDKIIIDATARTVTKNGGSIKSNLDYVESDFFHFTVSPGNQINVLPATATLKLTYKRRLL